MSKRAAILERKRSHAQALQKAHAYLATGDYADWHGFRPLFGGSRGRLPQRDWVANVVVHRRSAALTQCENALETLERKEKARRISLRRIGAK